MFQLPNKLSLVLGILLIGQLCAAHAEKADREKPIHIESDRMSLDNSNKISIFEGKVELTQGSLRLIAEKVVVTEDATGHKFCVASGHLASFRQKRDGANEYVEGYGERIEYNTLTEKIDLFVHARVKRDQDDVSGDHITYSTVTEIFRVNSPENTGRVRATLQPKNKDEKISSPKIVAPKEAETKDVQANTAEPKASAPAKVQPVNVEPATSSPSLAPTQSGY
jgi:lipopolysaccharide export system protein LptA